MDARKILIYLSLKFNGDWKQIYSFIISHKSELNNDEIEEAVSKLKTPVITIMDPEYPSELSQTRNPPFVLYYYGDISLLSNINNNLGVVGSRDFSEYGSFMTQKIVREVVDYFVIVSGLALGIDTIAHTAAINNKGKTIAVLASGIDYCYPVRNQELYDEIKKNHLVISEYPGAMIPNEDNFRFRNRIIAAISRGLLVCEARGNSGTLITVRAALENGKEVFCVPYRYSDNSHCNRLIREGALMTEEGDDIIYQLKKIPSKS